MPIKPLKPCTQPFCPNLTDGGRCSEHASQVTRLYEKGRQSASKRGYDRTWSVLRKMQLRREPYCQSPGCYEMATEVDHIVSMARGGRRLDPANLQSLCKPCHSRKTVLEDGGLGKKRDNQKKD